MLYLLVIYLLVSWPALQGGFVLDDWPNLGTLERVHDAQDVWRYTFSGIASQLGRPLAYFSFALQAEHWPHNPFPFKLANALIHFVNAVLVYMLALWMAVLLKFDKKTAFIFAALSGFLWLFLPLNTSTVFYVVQRMTLLAGTFTLIGVAGFLYAAVLEGKNKTHKARVVATLSMMAGYLFGVLSKENGILLGSFVTVLYLLVVRNQLTATRQWWDRWVLLFAVLPLLLTCIYLGWSSLLLGGYAGRDFTLAERFMTQWRILWDYVDKIILPTPQKINMSNDDVVVSTSLFSPLSTLYSLLGWLAITLLAWLGRFRWPFILFALAWFIGGHLLESTVVALELYFEHRNYLPSVGIIIAIVWCAVMVWQKLAARLPRERRKSLKLFMLLIGVAYAGWFMMVFAAEAKVWQDQKSFVLAGLTDRPNSLRANQEAASYLANVGDIKGSAGLLYTIERRWSGRPGTYAWLMYLHCFDGNVVLPDNSQLQERFSTGVFDRSAGEAFNEIYRLKQQGSCRGLSWQDYRYWLSELTKNPNFPAYGVNRNFLRLIIFSHVSQEDYGAGLEAINALQEEQLNIDMLQLKMELLILSGNDADALSLIQRVKSLYQQKTRVWSAKGYIFTTQEQKILVRQAGTPAEKTE